MLIFFKIDFLKKNLPGIPSECQTVGLYVLYLALRPDPSTTPIVCMLAAKAVVHRLA